MSGERVLWHPESPGVRVKVRVRWWWRWRKNLEFATIGEVLDMYRRRSSPAQVRGSSGEDQPIATHPETDHNE